MCYLVTMEAPQKRFWLHHWLAMKCSHVCYSRVFSIYIYVLLYYLTCSALVQYMPWRLVIFHSTHWIMYLSYASAHAHDSSNHSYVSMNMDSVNNCELFSLLHLDIYRSFFDDGVYESTTPLLELPISPSTNLAESSPRPQNDPA